jgi:predicted RecA/RadA family phage recombinase
MATKKMDGNVITIPATADTAFHDVVEFGTHSVGVVQEAGLTGEDIPVEIVGVYSFPATLAEEFLVGEIANWDNGTQRALALGATAMGMVTQGKGAGEDAEIWVKIG